MGSRPIRANPTASSHSISKVLHKATGNLQCRTNSIRLRASTALLHRSSNGVNHRLDSTARRHLISMAHPLKASMVLLPLSSSSGASRLPRKASMERHLQASMARRLLRGSMVRLLHRDSTGHHLHRDSTERPHHSSMVPRRRDSTNLLLSSNSMDLPTSRRLDTALSRPPTSMYLGMLRLSARP